MDRLAGHVAVTVTAHTPAGVAFDPRHGVALDSVLVSVLRSTGSGGLPPSAIDGGLDGGEGLHVWPLPLSRCGPERSPCWHWAATAGWPAAPDGSYAPGPAHHHRMWQAVNVGRAEHATPTFPTHLSGARGRYRDRVTWVPVWPCAALVWRAVGDPRQILRLVGNVPAVGARRGSGEGYVARWEVTETVTDNVDLFTHTHPDGRQGRPLPARCVDRLALPEGEPGIAGIRPPGFHPANQHPVVFPAGR